MCLQRLQVSVPKFEAVCELGLHPCLQIQGKSRGRASRKGLCQTGFQRGLIVPFVVTIVLLLAAIFNAPSGYSAPLSKATSAEDIIEEIGRLEQNQDPKCYATASRLEDFMFGTPLSFEARAEKNLRQANLLRDIWYGASTASEIGESGLLSSADIEAAGAAIIKTDREITGHWRVMLRGFEPIRINETDKRQYSSIAYSLRALLSVQQEILLRGDPGFKNLAPDAIQALKNLSDLFTLSVLKVADNTARMSDQREIDLQLLNSVWTSLLGGSEQSEVASPSQRGVPAELQENLRLQNQVIEEKVASYLAYNQVSNALFIRNLQVYFARKRWPASDDKAAAFTAQFQNGLVAWAANMYLSAQADAEASGSMRIEEINIKRFLDYEMAHEANPYEDITYFPALPSAQQVVIESYDIDAFRDSGIHWRFLQFALDELGDRVAMPADPFALELLTEAVANAGVLMLRLAGKVGDRGDRLTLADLNYAFQKMIDLRDANQRAPNELRGGSTGLGVVSAGRKQADTLDRWFTEITEQSGVDYHHRSSDWLSRQMRSYLRKDDSTGVITIPPAFGGAGIATADFDNDGLDDLLVLGGLGNKLFRNTGNGRFEDKTKVSGVGWVRPDGTPGEPRQPLAADLDNDGDQDILITYVNDQHRVYRNEGNWQFSDVTGESGLGGSGLVGGPATLLDIDNDGLLDLYVTYFGNYLEGVLPTLARRNDNGTPNQLFRNTGNFRFLDITESSGVGDSGWTQTAGHADFDGDGLQDLFSGNDFGINRFYRNNGDSSFTDLGETLGARKPSYTMGLTLSDLNQDGQVDFYVSNIVTLNKDQKYVLPSADTPMVLDPETLSNQRVVEANDLFLSRRTDGSVKYNLSDAVGRGYSSTGWSWGSEFFDPDLDGDDDLFVLNGMNEYLVYSPDNPYYLDPDGEAKDVVLPTGVRESNVFFLNENGKLQNRSRQSGLDFSGNSRALIYLDLEGDGDLDLITLDYHGPLRIFSNTLAQRFAAAGSRLNRNFQVSLKGDSKKRVNFDAIGSQVILQLADGRRLWRQLSSTSGYMAVPPKTLYFGLGDSYPTILEIYWPNGRRQTIELTQEQRVVSVIYDGN
jgi:hypothetical protein